MATSGFSRIAPGTAATAASVASRLSGVALAINDVPLASVEENSLTRQHIPSVAIGTPKTAALNNAVGAEAVYSSQGGGAYEPYPGWATVAGWKVLNDVGSAGGPNELTLTGLGITLSTTVSIEIIAEIEVADVMLWNFPGAAAAAAAQFAINVFGCFTLQYSNDNVTWYQANRWERYVDADSDDDKFCNTDAAGRPTEAQQCKRVQIATILKSTDPGGAIQVNYIRMVVSCHRGAFVGVGQHCRVRTRTGRISAQGFMHGTLS